MSWGISSLRSSAASGERIRAGHGAYAVQLHPRGTKYGLRLFPIGGFVSMEGEDEGERRGGFLYKGPGGETESLSPWRAL